MHEVGIVVVVLVTNTSLQALLSLCTHTHIIFMICLNVTWFSHEIYFVWCIFEQFPRIPTSRTAWKWQLRFTSGSWSARISLPTTTHPAIITVHRVTRLHPRIDCGFTRTNPAERWGNLVWFLLINAYVITSVWFWFLLQGLIGLLEDRDNEISDLKDYIDSLLLKVIDTCPTVLQTPVKAKTFRK